MNKLFFFLVLSMLSLAFAQEEAIKFQVTMDSADLPAQKLKLSVTLQEKSIFSKDGEIDFPKIIAKDTTAEGYRGRMGRVKARINQIDAEIVNILEDFGNTYPTLEPQKPDETAQDFEHRKNSWYGEGIKQVNELQDKYKAYKDKLERSLAILENNIIATDSLLNGKLEPDSNIGCPLPPLDDSKGLGWRGWARIVTFTATAALGAVAVVKHLNAGNYKDKINAMDKNPNRSNTPINEWNANVQNVRDYENSRNIFGTGAGLFAVAGILTFVF